MASRQGLPSQGAGRPPGGQESSFPPLAGGLGRLQLGFSKDYLTSVSDTHTLSLSTHAFNCLKTRSQARGGMERVSPLLLKRKGGNGRTCGESGAREEKE